MRVSSRAILTFLDSSMRWPEESRAPAAWMEIASVTCALECSQPNPLHLVLRQPLLRPVVKLGCSRALMGRHFLGVLERAAVGEVSGDPGGNDC